MQIIFSLGISVVLFFNGVFGKREKREERRECDYLLFGLGEEYERERERTGLVLFYTNVVFDRRERDKKEEGERKRDKCV